MGLAIYRPAKSCGGIAAPPEVNSRRRRWLAGLYLATLAPVLAACQGSGVTVAAEPVYASNLALSRDFCIAREQGRVVPADPASYQALIPTLSAGQTLILAPDEYPRLVIANIRGAPRAVASPSRGRPGAGEPRSLERSGTTLSRSSIPATLSSVT